MNIKALIEKYKVVECVAGIVSGKTILRTVLRDLKQLDEPEKVKVPQFVADWIEECKKKGDLSLGGAIQLPCPEIYEWLKDWGNQETFARAWLDGYEVEEEKRYLVKVKGISGYSRYLNKDLSSEKYFFASKNEINGYRTKYTRKQLEEADFGWVFDCPGIEIEEVE